MIHYVYIPFLRKNILYTLIFMEHYYTIPLFQFSTRFNDSLVYHNITLTAHILITIHEVMQMVEGSTRTDAAKASIKAVRLVPYLCVHWVMWLWNRCSCTMMCFFFVLDIWNRSSPQWPIHMKLLSQLMHLHYVIVLKRNLPSASCTLKDWKLQVG